MDFPVLLEGVPEMINLSIWLDSSTIKTNVYEEYTNVWEEMMKYYNEERCLNGLTKSEDVNPITKNGFLKVWNKHVGYLKISNSGSDLCDVCIKYKNIISNEIDENTKLNMKELLDNHKSEAEAEFSCYRNMYTTA